MHPNSFLNTFWRLELRPQVFVAMSFHPNYTDRYERVISPAIRQVRLGGQPLQPLRVDISSSGESILTSIIDGIAHSRLVLADVSTVGKDATSGLPYRNSNVMYEVGLALACRQPCDVLIVRDDDDKLLFDVSTILHYKINFTDTKNAVQQLSEQIASRINEQNFLFDARVQIAFASLSAEEVTLLKQMSGYSSTTIWARKVKGIANWYALATNRLLDKGIITLAGEMEEEGEPAPAFTFTPLGFTIHQMVKAGLKKIKPDKPAIDVETKENKE